jgi:hypothetical protein
MNAFYNKEGKEIQRTQCQVYTRVMGYLRPVSHYNTGKKSEFYSRKYFQESRTANSEFVRQFSNNAYDLVNNYEEIKFVSCGCPA